MMDKKNQSYMKYMKQDGIHYVPVWRIIGFSGANMAVNLYMGLTMIMSYYLNGYVGMAVILASSFTTIMRLWDGVTDPLVGFFVDKVGGKIGKTRLCLVAGGVLLFINSFLMFNVTDRLPEGILRPVCFIIFTLLYYIGYTFLNISNHVGNVCLTNDQSQRPILTIVGTVLVRVTRAIMQMVTAALAVKYGSMRSAQLFHEYWLIVAVIATIGIVIAYISIRPKDIPFFSETAAQENSKNKVKMSDYITVLRKNRPLQMMVVARATDMFANTCKTSAITLVLYGIIAGNYKLSGGWTMYTTIVGLVMMTLGIGTIGRKLGLKKAMQVGSWGVIILDAVAILIWLFCDPMTLNLPGYTNGYGEAFSEFTFFTVMLFIVTVVGGGFQMITSSIIPPMIADVNDYEASRSGKFIPGMVGTLFSFLDKMISAFGPMLVGVGFAMIGFGDKFPDLTTPKSTELLIIGLVFFYGLELIGAICNIIAMKFYDLTPEKMKEVEKTLYEMRAE